MRSEEFNLVTTKADATQLRLQRQLGRSAAFDLHCQLRGRQSTMFYRDGRELYVVVNPTVKCVTTHSSAVTIGQNFGNIFRGCVVLCCVLGGKKNNTWSKKNSAHATVLIVGGHVSTYQVGDKSLWGGIDD